MRVLILGIAIIERCRKATRPTTLSVCALVKHTRMTLMLLLVQCFVSRFSFLVPRFSFLVSGFWFLVSGFLFLVKTNHLPDNVVVFWNAFACVYCTGCLGMFDGWGAKMPFVWAALLYLCTATFCWHTAIRNGVRTKTTRRF
eukprot:COSAG06_NODE_853_length_11950_cov_3.644249_7_plen_142_part_00